MPAVSPSSGIQHVFLKSFTVVGFNLILGEPAFFPSCLDAVESDFVVSALTLFSSESTLSTSSLNFSGNSKRSSNRSLSASNCVFSVLT